MEGRRRIEGEWRGESGEEVEARWSRKAIATTH